MTAFPAGRFYLARLDDGAFLALGRECTHLGCTVPWSQAEGRFVCPCHDSRFAADGTRLGGESPRDLDPLEARVEEGRVLVRYQRFETGTSVRRTI